MAEISHSRIAMDPKEESLNATNGDTDSKSEGERSRKRQATETLTDRISELPDSLILHILCLLNCTKEAVKTSALSRRWRYLWTYLQSLNFSCYRCFRDGSLLHDFAPFVNKTLTNCNIDAHLTSFKLHFIFEQGIERAMNDWLRYAFLRKVQELEIDLGDRISDMAKFLLPQFLFVNSVFTKLKLRLCLWKPDRQIEWKMLKLLRISDSPLTEDLIENILSGSPTLESLELTFCYGFNRLVITSKSVKRLVFDGYSSGEFEDILEVKAPNVLSLDITGMFFLWKIIMLDMSSVVIANLNYTKYGKDDPGSTSKETNEEIMKGFLKSLHHAKEIKVGCRCSKVLYNLQAKGFSFPESMKLHIDTPIYDSDGDLLVDEAMGDPTVDLEADIDEVDHGHGGGEVEIL